MRQLPHINHVTHDFQFGGAMFRVVGDAVLYWPTHNIILVSDLHLEKASSYARNGQMLPPYDSIATLSALSILIKKSGAKAVICLGDNFHDDGGESRLSGKAAILLRQLTEEYDWTWVTGNHDPGLEALWGGHALEEIIIDGITLRHEANANFEGPEISGHFHPKLRAVLKRRHIWRRCFVVSNCKIIMPAFGSLTGGMDAGETAICAQPSLAYTGTADAVVGLPARAIWFPLPCKKQKITAAQ
jgi:uncharacterized protein